MMALQIARMTGQDDQLAAAVPEGLVDARAQLEAGLLALEENHGLRFERTFVGGFSQGAMLSCDWVLHSGRELAGLIQLSGTVICEAQWRQSLPKRAGLRVFQSHSPDDQVLPFSLAQRLARAMREAGLQHEFVSFRGGHGIGPDVSLALSRFLDS
jgi:phospholipase/carboxylesterase